MKIAFVVSSPHKHDLVSALGRYGDLDFEYDVLYLSTTKEEKILKRDLTLDLQELSGYDLICPVGADGLKHVCNLTGITKYAGSFVEPNFVPFIDPTLAIIKPQYAPILVKSMEVLKARISGEVEIPNEKHYYHITSVEEAKPFIDKFHNVDVLVCDIETTSLSPRTGVILGFAFSTEAHEGIYMDADIVEHYYQDFENIFATKKIVFHNGKFDIAFIEHEFGFEFPDFEDTMLLHYVLDESVGSHGLKLLAMKFTDLGDYDRELEEYKKIWARRNKVLLKDFNYGMLPEEILAPYAAKDADGTMQIFLKFYDKVQSSDRFRYVYEHILKPGSRTLQFLENSGGPIDESALDALLADYQIDIEETVNEIMRDPAVIRFEEEQNKPFNPNSLFHLREVFFNILKLKPIKKTDTGAYSTDAEVLGLLNHPLADAILELRKKVKLTKTYLINIKMGIDKDKRLRSNFNITGTTSGRLSSSGVLNYQNLPRDEDAGIKHIFKARPGYSIVQCDLSTAEVYVAAVISGDKFLQQAFIDKLDFHSYVAHSMFKLPCEVSEVKKLYPEQRQHAKAITFGILYGAGASRIADEAGVSMEEAKDFINKYFDQAKTLRIWIDGNLTFINANAYIYSAFGRKRRLPEVRSGSRGMAGHTSRSGLNFLIQSVSSDINLMSLISLVNWIIGEGYQKEMQVFATVHDSIVAEVKDEYIDLFCAALGSIIQRDRGISIPGRPIGFDIEVGPTWGEVESYQPQEVRGEPTWEKYGEYTPPFIDQAV